MGSLSAASTVNTTASSINGKLAEGLSLTRSPDLILLMNTPKGRGIFASKDIPAKTIIEVSPVLVLDPQENIEHVSKTNLYNYTYNWPYTPAQTANTNGLPVATTKPPATTQAVILGIGSMFNHSALRQNVGWERDPKNLLVTYSTLRDIKEGEELCISYGDVGRLTFRDVDEEGGELSDEGWEEELLRTGIIDLID